MGDDGVWRAVLAYDELPERRSTRVMLDEVPVMLYRADDRIYAIGARCTHMGAPLERGPVKIGGSLATVTCPAHGSTFRLEDGAVVRGPATRPVPAFDVRVEDGSIELRGRSG
jgi:nitrite reductase/ring-hydroxylating ferredoxin subunit